VLNEAQVKISGFTDVKRVVCAAKDVQIPHADDDAIVGQMRSRILEAALQFDSPSGREPRFSVTGLAMSEAA
jgi:hypothetical protein